MPAQRHGHCACHCHCDCDCTRCLQNGTRRPVQHHDRHEQVTGCLALDVCQDAHLTELLLKYSKGGDMAFVKEKIPQDFLDSFDMSKLFVPYGKDWPIHTWTADHERRVAWIPITTDSNVAADEGRPTQTWYTMLLEGHVIGVLAEDGVERLLDVEPESKRSFRYVTLENASFLIPDALIGREREIVELASDALYVDRRGPERAWIKGAKVNGVSFNKKSGGKLREQ